VSFRYVDTTSAEDQEEIREASAARRRFLLLFDKSFTEPAGLHRAQRAAVEFIRHRLAESDLVAVATFDVLKGLRLVANFTEDRGLLVHAVETLGVPGLTRISDPLGLAADLLVTDTALFGGQQAVAPSTMDGVLRVLVRRMRSAEDQLYTTHVRNLIGGLADLARGLRSVEGRKQILYFSAGFDSRFLVGYSGQERRDAAASVAQGALWDVDQTRYGDNRVRDLLTETTRSLSRADVVVHSIDVTGLGGPDDSLSQTAATTDAIRDPAGRESLNLLAAETGGRFFKDANDLGPVLQEMLDMTSRYYILGVQPAAARGPGAFHRLKVKVHRKNVRVSHRAGFFEKLPVAQQTLLQRQFEAAELVVTGAGPQSLRFSTLCLPFPSAEGRQTLGLVIQVPRGEVSWEAGKPTSLEVYAYAVAEDGTVHDHLAQLARLDPGQADPRGAARGVSLYGTLAVPPGQYTIRLLVQERDSGAKGVQFLDVTVPRYDARQGFLLPPVVMEDVDGWLSQEMGRAGERTAFPFQVDGRPFLPRASLEVRRGTAEKLVLIAYEPSRPGDPAADVEINASLIDGDGRRMAPGSVRIDRVHRDENGRRTYVIGYVPEAVSAGDYTLRVGVSEGPSRLESYSLIRIRAGS
jgi:VWFA-related protein